MAATLEMLKERLARLQQELAEMSAALDEWGAEPHQTAQQGTAHVDPLADFQTSDPREMLPLIDQAFAQMGVPEGETVLTPRQVQEQMLREGVLPGDNLGSRTIIQARNRLLGVQ